MYFFVPSVLPPTGWVPLPLGTNTGGVCHWYTLKVSRKEMRGIKKFQHGSVNIDIRTFMVFLMYLYMN
jgi:hypothetical protein